MSPNDIDVDWEKEIVYMSDASVKWGQDYLPWAIIESDASSRYGLEMKTIEASV